MSQTLGQVYENPVMTGHPKSSHFNGSFGPVFTVLAVIVVISTVACVLGRLCSKRNPWAKEGAKKLPKPGQQGQALGPKEWESRQKPSFNTRDGDIEFGFGKKFSQGTKNIGGRGMPIPYNGDPYRPEVRFSDNV